MKEVNALNTITMELYGKPYGAITQEDRKDLIDHMDEFKEDWI